MRTPLTFFAEGDPKGQPRARACIREDHKAIIIAAYRAGFTCGDGTIRRLESVTGMLRSNIARFAKSHGLTSAHRSTSAATCDSMKLRAALWYETNPHPRGMAGKTHTKETKAVISRSGIGRKKSNATVMKSMKTRIERHGSYAPSVKRGNWKSEWVTIGGHRFFARSRWEAAYASHLELLRISGTILDWNYEPRTFWFPENRRPRCYRPDFGVTLPNGDIEIHEVKGWMCPRSIAVLSLMAEHYPNTVIVIRSSDWFRANPKLLTATP